MFQCLITLKNLLSCFLAIFNVDALPVFVLILPKLHEQKEKKMTKAATFLPVTPMNFKALYAYRSS